MVAFIILENICRERFKSVWFGCSDQYSVDAGDELNSIGITSNSIKRQSMSEVNFNFYFLMFYLLFLSPFLKSLLLKILFFVPNQNIFGFLL